MPRILGLTRSDLRRLERLAKEAGTTPARILKAVLRDGFEYTEWFVRRVSEGDAGLKAGRVVSTTGHLTRSRANLRRLRSAHAEIEAEIARRKVPGSGASGAAALPVERYTARRVREFDRAEAELGQALRRSKRRKAALRKARRKPRHAARGR